MQKIIKKYNIIKTNLLFNFNLKQNPKKYFLKTHFIYHYLVIINCRKIFKLEKFIIKKQPVQVKNLLNFHILKEKTKILISFHNYSPLIL